MTNPFAGLITTEFKALFTNAIDALLEQQAITLPCQLLYGTEIQTYCPNCVFDIMAKKSSSRYKTGGPISFPNGQICPVCVGAGYIMSDTSEDISMMVIYDSADWVKFTGGRYTPGIPEKYTLTFSRLDETYSKIKQAREILIDTSIANVVTNRFQKVDEPTIMGLGESTYILTKWKSVGA